MGPKISDEELHELRQENCDKRYVSWKNLVLWLSSFLIVIASISYAYAQMNTKLDGRVTIVEKDIFECKQKVFEISSIKNSQDTILTILKRMNQK